MSFRYPRNGALFVVAAVAIGACTDPVEPIELGPDDASLATCETCLVDDDGNTVYNTSYDYGDYWHYYQSTSMYAEDQEDVDPLMHQVYDEDPLAFDPDSRDWSDPEQLIAWPAVAFGVRYAVRAGRALARTSRFREAVRQGARWARDVSVVAAGAMLAGTFPIDAEEEPEDFPVEDFDFMFDFSSQ